MPRTMVQTHPDKQERSGQQPGHRTEQGRGETGKANARLAALRILNKVFLEGAYANIAVNQQLSKSNLSDLDRRFVTELVYGTVKAKGTLDWILGKFLSRSLSQVEPVIVNILRMSVYQIYFWEKVPDSAACNEGVNLVKQFSHAGVVKFVNAVLRSCVRQKGELVYPSLEEDKYLHLALTKWHPLWLVKRWVKQYGLEEAAQLCDFDNLPPTVSLRVNTLVTTREAFLQQLQEAGFEAQASKWSPDGIVCTRIPSLKLLFTDFAQYFYIQDESSMLVGTVLNPQPGELVLDVCSAPGGKATHLATLMQDQGQVLACDLHPHKLALIKENAARLGLHNLQALEQDALIFRPEWEAKADRVLVDAPCSGLGVLRRRAEARWTKAKQDLKAFPALQGAILTTAARYVKPGGFLVYSTCTIEQCENHYVVQAFLDAHPQWGLAGFAHPLTGEQVPELQLYPQRDGIDGFYLALLQKRSE